MAKKAVSIRIKKQQAQILFKDRRLDDARKLYQQITHINPDDPEVWAMLGVIAGQSGQMHEAAGYFRKSVALRPDFAEGWYNLGKACKDLGQYEEAASSYEKALQLRPDWLDALNNLGHVLNNVGRMPEAVACYRRVLAIDPGFAAAYKSLSGLLIALGELDEASAYIQKLKQLKPGRIDAQLAEAKILQRLGLLDQAYAMTQPLHESHPDNLEVVFLYASLCRQTGRNEVAIRLFEQLLSAQDKTQDLQQQSTLHFRLGDLYDAQHDYQQAFSHYQSANQLKRQAFRSEPFKMQDFVDFVDNLISGFRQETMQTLPRSAQLSERPIFIIGMPRSGTTLVEQILDSHPAVYGAGELRDIDAIASRLLRLDDKGRFSPDSLVELHQEECNTLTRQYLDTLSKYSTDTRFVTDKMPQNFLHLGVIALLFPQAHVIHCIRDPLDNCLSCFFQNFGATHSYTYGLETLGRYYKEYQRLMRHWHDVLDISILDVHYEVLVTDHESVTRSLLEFCGLEWDDRCLRFYENERIVNTLSHEQVRLPVYTRSVGRWKHYEPYIQPLIDILKQ